ncbi:MAG: PDZ domain-containing protein [Planctomycetaceae bacterium]|nr:PDZ domain-containing protein [Planctomycetaceae bacterium]
MTKPNCFLHRGTVVAAAAIWYCLVTPGPAQTKRSVKHVHEVSPGVSKLTDIQGKAWSNKTSETAAADGTRCLEYAIKPWKKVVVIAKGGEVIGIDLYPPPKFTPKAIGEVFKLGRLDSIEQLPAEARFATEGISGDLLESQEAFVVLEVEDAEGKQVVKRIRFFGEKPVVLESSQQPGSVRPSSRPTANYFGVVPGCTTRDELFALPNWGKPLKTVSSDEAFNTFEYFGVEPAPVDRKPDELRRKLELAKNQALHPWEKRDVESAIAVQGLQGTVILEYRIAAWTKVIAIVQGDIVWAVDLFPRPGMRVQDVEKALEVKEILPWNQSLDTEPAECGDEKSIHSRGYFMHQGLRIWTDCMPSTVYYQEYLERRVGIFFIPDLSGDPEQDQYRGTPWAVFVWKKTRPPTHTGEVKAIRLFADIPLRHPRLGIDISDVVGDEVPKGLEREKAVLVNAVLPGSAAAEAGFEVGDVVLSVGSNRIDDCAHLQRRVLSRSLCSLGVFDVWRDGKEEKLRVRPKLESLASAVRRRGYFYFKGQMFKEAIADMSTALKLNPDDVPTRVNRGTAFWKVGDSEKALEDWNRALEIDPHCAPAHANRAVFSARRGDDEQALKDFNEAVRLDPKCILALRGRAALYRRLGENEKAAADEARARAMEERTSQRTLEE